MQQSADPSPPASLPVAALRMLRPHQWVKNVLLLLPLLLAHVLPWHGRAQADQWLAAIGGFVAFCLTASAIYVINDLKDLDADRLHASKRTRPFASGVLPTKLGPPMVIALLGGAAAVCLILPAPFAIALIAYVILGTAYSVWLKQRLLLDVFVLAGLYTLRLLAGGYAGSVEVSKWLLAFSIFFFVSLAFAKRYAELVMLADDGQNKAKGRNYTTGDLRLVESAGLASGYLAVLVMALYINDASSAASKLYTAPLFLWLLCPLLMYWITRIWFVAGRRALDDDPILFAIRDRVSWCTLLVAIAIVIAAWQPWHV